MISIWIPKCQRWKPVARGMTTDKTNRTDSPGKSFGYSPKSITRTYTTAHPPLSTSKHASSTYLVHLHSSIYSSRSIYAVQNGLLLSSKQKRWFFPCLLNRLKCTWNISLRTRLSIHHLILFLLHSLTRSASSPGSTICSGCLSHRQELLLFLLFDPWERTAPLNIVLVVEQISRASIFLVAMLFQASAAYCPQFIKSRVVKDKTWRKKDRFGMEPIKFWQFNRVLPSNVVAMDEYYDTPIAQRTVRSHIPSLCPSCCN